MLAHQKETLHGMMRRNTTVYGMIRMSADICVLVVKIQQVK